MNVQFKAKGNRFHFRWSQSLAALLSLVMLLSSQPFVPAAVTPALAATSNTLHLHVISANDSSNVADSYGISKGDPVTDYRYIINEDNSGTTTQRSPADGCNPNYPGYPDTCNWVSIASVKGSSPIFTQGDQSDFGPGIAFPDSCTAATPCRYLVSVLADNFKIDGAHFTVPIENDGNVTVEMRPSRQRSSKILPRPTARRMYLLNAAWPVFKAISQITSMRSQPTCMATRCAATITA
jgi:hypothetical protein